MSIKIEQGLIDHFIDQSFGLPIAHENDDYTPTAGTAYVALKVFPNEETGLDITNTNQTTGFFQFTLRYPVGAGAMTAKTMRESIFAAYQVGQTITYSGQQITITGRYAFDAAPEDGWFKVIGRINYSALIDRA